MVFSSSAIRSMDRIKFFMRTSSRKNHQREKPEYIVKVLFQGYQYKSKKKKRKKSTRYFILTSLIYSLKVELMSSIYYCYTLVESHQRSIYVHSIQFSILWSNRFNSVYFGPLLSIWSSLVDPFSPSTLVQFTSVHFGQAGLVGPVQSILVHSVQFGRLAHFNALLFILV